MQLATLFFTFALITTLPAFFVLTKPFLSTVARLVFDEDHFTVSLVFFTIALSCLVFPTYVFTADGEIDMLTVTAFVSYELKKKA